MEIIVRTLLYVVLVPAGLGAAGAIVARFLKPDSPGRPIAAALGVALGYFAAHAFNTGVPPKLPPIDTLGWIPYVGVAAALALLGLERQPPRFRALGLILVLGIGAGAAYLVGRPSWTDGTRLAIGLGTVAVGGTLVVASLERAASQLPAWALGFSLVAAATGGSITSLFNHTALGAMLFGALAAAVGGLAFFGLFLKSAVPGRALLAAFTLIAASLLLYVRLFSYPQPATLPIALSGASLLAPFLSTLIPASPKLRPWLSIALTLAFAGAAAGLAYTPEAPGSGGEYVG